MQELQRQKEFWQLDARQQNSINQMPFFARQPSSGHPPTLINGNPIADASYPWGELTVGNSNWLQCGSPAMQGASTGQAPRSMGFDLQQADQSLYGVPVSISRGNLNQYPHLATDKTSIQKMTAYNNSFPGNNYTVFPEQVTVQDGTLVSRQAAEGKSLFTHTFGQSANSGINVDHLQQLNSLQRNASGQEFQEPQDLIGSSEILQDQTAMTAAMEHSAASLDPTEEKFLFGSNDNIWDAFGRNTDMGGGASNLLDGNDFMSGLPSVQSGSWSALMQSAVVETSISDIGLQDELAGLSFQNPELAIGVHQPSMYDGTEKRETALADDLPTSSAVSFGSVHSDGANINNNCHSVTGFQQYGKKKLYEHGEGLQINSSERLRKLSSGRSKWFNRGAVQNPHTEGGQIYENASRPLDVGMDEMSTPVHWTSQPHGPSQVGSKPNSWSAIESVPRPCGDTEHNFNRIEHRLQNSQGHILDQRGEAKQYDEARCRGVLPGYMPNMFVSMDKSSAPNKSYQPSQNMFELLHKVDQSREHGMMKHFNPSEPNQSSEIPDAENSDGSVGHLQRSPFSKSQGFGLQLAPPLQQFSVPNHASPSTVPSVYSNSSTQASSDIRDKCHRELASPYSVQTHKFHSILSQSHQLNIVESTTSGGQNLDNQDLAKRGNFPSKLRANSVNSQGFVCLEDEVIKGSPSQKVSSGNVDPVHKFNEPQEKESLIKNTSDASTVYPVSTLRDLEAFGHSLKQNNFHQSYSLLSQMQAVKDSDSGSSHRGTKRLKGPDNFLGDQEGAPRMGQPNKQNPMVGDVAARYTIFPSADSKMLSFTGPVDNDEKSTSSQRESVPSKDMLAFHQNESQNYAHGNILASIKEEHSQISPQMALSWFNQYGTFKNGQILAMYDMHKAATVKPIGQSFNHGSAFGSLETDNAKEVENAASDTGQVGVILQNSVLPSVAIEHFSSPLPVNVAGQNFVVLRPKKRKSLHPWHKEVSQVSRNLHMFSMTVDEWAKSANRLTEKVEDVAEMIDDISPITRPKKRLILTTQLMQQLLRPPPATILSADATAHYESVSYFVALLALGDTCSLVSSARSCSDVPHGGSNSSKPYERIGDQHLLEVIEALLGRARKLENDFLRLDKRVSVLDLRVECQDLEKFSAINRFARFHGRGQSDGAKSSLSDAAASARKSFLQRYVTAVPLPKNLPDRGFCDEWASTHFLVLLGRKCVTSITWL